MRKYIHIIVLFLGLFPTWLSAQLWQSMGGGANRWVRAFYADTTENLLYVAGSFDVAGGVHRFQVATWNGQQWASVGAGTGDTNCFYGCNPIFSMIKHEGQLFVGGQNFIMDGIFGHKFLNKWDGAVWDTCGNPNAPVFVESANGNLFGMGAFHEISGHPIQSLARWNGQSWERFTDSVPFPSTGFLNCVAYFQGKYFFGGNFSNSLYHEIISWDSSGWSIPDGGIKGDSWVNKLCAYKNLLFVAGEFSSGSGNASSYITAWDGTRWIAPFPDIDFVGQVRDLQVIDGILYLVGTHQIYDGLAWHGYYEVAKYDGVNFCSFGGINYQVQNISGLNGNLYIGTERIVHGDTVGYCAQWAGGDSVDYCVFQPVRVADPVIESSFVSLFPNPSHSTFTLTLPPTAGSSTISIRDITGRQVGLPLTYHAGDAPVDVEALPAGLYFVEVSLRGKAEVIKLIKQ